MTRKVATITLLLFLISLGDAEAQSYSTDFDGAGTGTYITVGSPQQLPPGPQQTTPSTDAFGQAMAGLAVKLLVQFFIGLFHTQSDDAQRLAEEQRLRAEMQAAQDRADAQAVSDITQELTALDASQPSPVARSAALHEVLDLLPGFAQTQKSVLAAENACYNQLSEELPPAPSHPTRHLKRILILGMAETPAAAKAAMSDSTNIDHWDPFSGGAKPFDGIFAFATANDWKGLRDLSGRVFCDHVLGGSGQLSKQTASQLSSIVGIQADEVVCHSNGCQVAEVLIERGLLKVTPGGVLRVLGGDSALLDLDRLRTLATVHDIRVEVYAIRGDPVTCLGAPCAAISDLMSAISQPLRTYHAESADLTYQMLGVVARPPFSTNKPLQVFMLSTPATLDPLHKHYYDTYYEVIEAWKAMGCLTPGGSIGSQCIITGPIMGPGGK